MGKKSVKIQEIRELMAEYGVTCIEHVDIESLRDLREVFESLEDKRFEPYVEHLLSDIVMITLIGVLANADEWTQIAAFAEAKGEWLKSFLKLPNGIPSHDTIQRVMSMIDGTVPYSLSIQFLVERIDSLAGTRRQLKDDHHIGNIRGFICDSCNTGLGRLKNGENYLMNAVNYIKEHDTLV